MDFAQTATRVRQRLGAESAAGRRDPELDRDLALLRGQWRDLQADDRDEVAAVAQEIGRLASARPAATEHEPAGTTPSRPGGPPPREPALFDEQAQARLALTGLERLPAPAAEVRRYDGPADPDALLAHIGLEQFRPGQRPAVEAGLQGRDALVVMPTGGGKSLCYQLPGLASADLTVVVSPLIALMADQVRRLTADGHPAAMIASGLGADVNRAALDAIVAGETRIVFCSPERFASTAFVDALAQRTIDLFAVDEAHCLSEWGHDFRPDYLRLPRAIERLGRPAVMACTATATPEVADEIVARLGLREPLLVRSGFDRPNLSFDVVTLEGKGSKARKLGLLEAGLAEQENRPAIVYCGTRRDTEEVADRLREAGRDAVAYHAGMAPDERAAAQHRFMEGDAEVVVATNAFGMGVDKADVRSVWHWAIPTSVEAWYQEAGRAGRDGALSRAVLLASRSDLGRLVRFNERRAVEPVRVLASVEAMRNRADANGRVVIDAPRGDDERVMLGVAERAGALSVEPADGGRLALTVHAGGDAGAVARECRVAKDRGWRAYRAVEAAAFTDACRRRALLDHFGDHTEGNPEGRCCDVCDPLTWLPDPSTIVVRKTSRKSRSEPEPSELAPADARLYEALTGWRLEASEDKPAYTVAHNRTLREIAVGRPADEGALRAIHGVGPSFAERHGDAVLALVADYR